MEEYRRRLEKEIIWYKVLAVIFFLLAVVAIIATFKEKWGSGLGGGFLAASLNSIRWLKENKELLKDQEKLKKHYIEVHDERLDRIGLKTSRMTLGIVLITLSIAVTVLLFIPTAKMVLFTLVVVLIFMVLVLFIAHAIYSRLI